MTTLAALEVSLHGESKMMPSPVFNSSVLQSELSAPEISKKNIAFPVDMHPPHSSQISGVNPPQSAPPKAVLDGFMLLASTGMGFPRDARTANVSNKQLRAVVEEDLTFFADLLYLDVSENFLDMRSFHILPKLKELRIACNNIKDINFDEIPLIHGLRSDSFPVMDNSILSIKQRIIFHKLMYLDLSYNRISPNSVMFLSSEYIPNLKELDISGNGLLTLPRELHKFTALEKLIVSRNRLQDNEVFFSLSCIPLLRHLDVSYNYLSKIPPLILQNADAFRYIDFLDISFNFFGNEDDVRPILQFPRILSVILYGNPVLGPTGEDILKAYVEDLCNEAFDIRSLSKSSLPDIEIITEIPRKRRKILKNDVVGRLASYRNFSMAAVDSTIESDISNQTAEQWRKMGRKTLFGEAVEFAKFNNLDVVPDTTTTFITALTNADQIQEMATNVMCEVAENMNITTNVDLLKLKDMAALAPAYLSEKIIPNESLPVDDFIGIGSGGKRALGEPNTLQASADDNPNLVAALRSLRFALDHPLTNYTEVPVKGFLPPKRFHHQTAASNAHRKPIINSVVPANILDNINASSNIVVNKHNSISNVIIVGDKNKNSHSPSRRSSPGMDAQRPSKPRKSGSKSRIDALLADKQHGATGVKLKTYDSPSHRRNKYVNLEQKHESDTMNIESLHQIEEMLDCLNLNVQNVFDSNGLSAKESAEKQLKVHEQVQLMKGFARPNRDMNNLVSLLNEITADL